MRKSDRVIIQNQFYASLTRTHCFLFISFLLLSLGIAAVVFSLLVVSSCDFVQFAAINSTDPNATLVEFSFGQFRYDTDDSGCISMNGSNLKIDWPITTGRVSTFVALLCAGVACVFIIVEFMCCRFKLSRCLLATLFCIAIVGMALAFLSFASNVWCVEHATLLFVIHLV